MTDPGPDPTIQDAGQTSTAEDLSFEEALGRLEQIVEDLEGGEMTLEESLTRFEEGMGLRALCLARLEAAETRIEQVLADAAEPDAKQQADQE